VGGLWELGERNKGEEIGQARGILKRKGEGRRKIMLIGTSPITN
jgi:hypothetical protein